MDFIKYHWFKTVSRGWGKVMSRVICRWWRLSASVQLRPRGGEGEDGGSKKTEMGSGDIVENKEKILLKKKG